MARRIGSIRVNKRLADGSERWIVDLRPHGRIISSPDPITGAPVPLASRQAALDVLESIRGAYAAGKTIDAAVAAFTRARTPHNMVPARAAAWLERRRQDAASGDISPGYVRELTRYVNAPGYFPWWADVTIWDVTFGGIDDWSRAMAAQGLGANTRRKVLQGFRAFLADLVRRGELERVPQFPRIPVDEYVPRTTTLDVQDAIVNAVPEDRRGAFLAARLGLRPNEVRALNVGDYEFATGTLTIRAAMKGGSAAAPRRSTKERNVRRILVDAELRAWIEKHVDPKLALAGAPLFANPTSRHAAARWIGSALRREWNRAAEKIGVRVRMYEGTKHTTATEALRAGRRMEDIQQALGHRDRRSTERYARLAEVAKVEDLFRGRR
ncbi:MAG TPA: site-specific integrase [Myxococcota bacterium]|nr:site-specific integrase [Myxococcota bacterium]